MTYDVIIIGAGSMGMAAGYFVSKQGKKVLLLDAHDPPHSEGSHHGETRLIRHAYGEGASYVPLALRAQKLWLDLEKETGEKLFLKTGVLNAGMADSPFIENVINSADIHGLDVEVMNAGQINNRWPGFKLPENMVGCFEKDSGVLMSEKGIQAYKNAALRHGATLQASRKVDKIDIEEETVCVRSEGDLFRGKTLLVTAGSGTSSLLDKLGLKLPLQTVRKTFSWFRADERVYGSSVFPSYTFDFGDEMYYGFPSIDGAGVKIGRHDGGQPLAAGQVSLPYGSFPEDEQDVSSFSEKVMSEKLPLKTGKICKYTNTPDNDFIIDRHPDHSHIFFACGFSGHGFKFASAIGEILADLAVEKKPQIDLSAFSVSRFS